MHSLSASVLGLALTLAGCGGTVDPLLDRAEASDVENGANTASTDDQSCTGVVAGGTYENVTVPEGSTCTLRGVTVRGNVVALKNARLIVEDSRVGGNIQGKSAALVHVRGGRLGGDLQVDEGVSTGELGVSITGGTVLEQGNIQIMKMRTGQVVVSDAVLEKGNLQLEENEVTNGLEVARNRVAQNLEVRKNRGGGAKVVRENTVGQKVECKENDSPFVGGPNAASEAEGQCS